MPFSELLGADNFASGVCRYVDRFSGDPNTRLVIEVVFGSQQSSTVYTSAIVDTGAPWCILNPEEAAALDMNLYPQLQTDRLIVRGIAYNGNLYRIPVTLSAYAGNRIEVEATVFVPLLMAGETWLLPNFLGLEGFLHRLRFAVDPEHNDFYFGSFA